MGRLAFLALAAVVCLSAAESDALSISQSIVKRHMPYGTILDPVTVAEGSKDIAGYSRAADSAIWTGHYLAAESYRYAVTRTPEALENVRRAMDGIRMLVAVTQKDLLARCLFPVDSPFAPGILQEESNHQAFTSILDGRFYYWLGNTSRDQYSGVMFGLGVAYDVVDDPGVRAQAKDLVTRLLGRLIDDDWAVVMPGGSVSTVFWGRSDQQLAFLSVGRHVNPDRFNEDYKWSRIWNARLVIVPVAAETLDSTHSYFKFNLDVINLFHLIRLEGNKTYRKWFLEAYNTLRKTIDDHQNPHFNMIDRGLKGADDRRDRETRVLLDAWLKRPLTNTYVDLRGQYAACSDDSACDVIPVEKRVPTDFLWQRNPFQLYGGGDGRIESAGIDYILPYWMARFYGVL